MNEVQNRSSDRNNGGARPFWVDVETMLELADEEAVVEVPAAWRRVLFKGAPKDDSERSREYVRVRFGQREMHVCLLTEEPDAEAGQNGDPVIRISPAVQRGLLLPDGLSYRALLGEGFLRIGPVIGLVLGEQKYMHHDRNMGEFTDALRVYEEIGGLVVAFKASSIDWAGNCAYGLYYHAPSNSWKYGKLPLPSVIYLRAYNVPPAIIVKLQKVTQGRVFNSIRYDKWQVYEKARKYERVAPHLPDTALVTSVQVVWRMLAKYGRIILKPIGLSRARGILILETLGDNRVRTVDYTSGTGKKMFTHDLETLANDLQKKRVLEGHYIAQPHLSLARIDGSPWDVRVVMQKNECGVWQCSGIECRHAGMTEWITNISRGGRALKLADAAKLSFGEETETVKLKRDIVALAHAFCQMMEEGDGHFAEFGLDIAVDREGGIWLIEANVRPTFTGFRRMDLHNYYYICGVPLRYAAGVAWQEEAER